MWRARNCGALRVCGYPRLCVASVACFGSPGTRQQICGELLGMVHRSDLEKEIVSIELRAVDAADSATNLQTNTAPGRPHLSDDIWRHATRP